MSQPEPSGRAAPLTSRVTYGAIPARSALVAPGAVRGSIPALISVLPVFRVKAPPICQGAGPFCHCPSLAG